MITLENIHKEVNEYFQYKENEIFAKTQKRHIVEVRQIFHYLAKHFNPVMSYNTIGKYADFSTSHATIMNSEKTVKNLMETDPWFKNNVKRLTELLTEKYRK